jgi:hypothetical protein
MAGITTYLSILTLNVKNLTPPSKDTIWQIALKRKIQQSVVYRRNGEISTYMTTQN